VASFGLRLKQEREKQAVTLDDISLSTKISTRMLRALEEERFDQLPGGIFNKGFIRAYARCLGMDEDQAVADYLAATGASLPGKQSEIDDQAPILEPPSREQNPAAAGIPWGIFAAALLIVALGLAAWGYYSRESQKETHDSAATAPNPTPPPVAEPSPSHPGDTNAATAEVAKPSQPTLASTAGGESSKPPLANPSVSPSTQPPPPRTGGLTLLIKARQDSWLSISVDGEVSTQGTLSASAQKSVRAAQEIVIRAGNVGALDLEFNGKQLPVQGELNEVKTLTFNTHGLQPPTPKPEEPKPEAPAQLP
jgi:cytoskeleton protein RodZ